MMQNKKKAILVISAIFYVSIIGFVLPYMLIVLDLYHSVYDSIEDMASTGVFFLSYLVGTFVFFPFIYSTITKEKLSLSLRSQRKNAKNPRYYASILFIIGIPIMIWLIIGACGYYSISEFSYGLGELVLNGFLVMLIMLMYFCIIPASILSFKKSKESL